MNFSYESVMRMPIYERRVYINMFREEIEAKKEAANGRTTPSGSGTRTTTLSGDALKTQIKSGKIPQ